MLQWLRFAAALPFALAALPFLLIGCIGLALLSAVLAIEGPPPPEDLDDNESLTLHGYKMTWADNSEKPAG